MGLMGACRGNELHAMSIADVQDLGSAVLVTIPKTKNKVVRKFTVTDAFYKIVKNYMNLRPTEACSSAFFLNFQKGKCTNQRIGINKFGGMGKEIVNLLTLTNP